MAWTQVTGFQAVPATSSALRVFFGIVDGHGQDYVHVYDYENVKERARLCRLRRHLLNLVGGFLSPYR